jgi:hypothetical protein
MSKHKQPSDFANAREMIDYLGGDDKCDEEGCKECRVIDREEAVYFVGELFARIERLEAALREIAKSPRMTRERDIARAALAGEVK